jgi:hypothetical protein
MIVVVVYIAHIQKHIKALGNKKSHESPRQCTRGNFTTLGSFNFRYCLLDQEVGKNDKVEIAILTWL